MYSHSIEDIIMKKITITIISLLLFLVFSCSCEGEVKPVSEISTSAPENKTNKVSSETENTAKITTNTLQHEKVITSDNTSDTFPSEMAIASEALLSDHVETETEDHFDLKTPEISESEIEYLSFKELINTADTIVNAVFDYSKQEDETRILHFRAVETIAGGKSESEINIYDPIEYCFDPEKNLEYISGKNKYIPNHKYYLILERHDSVFYEEPRYFILGNSFISVNDDSSISALYYDDEPIIEVNKKSPKEFEKIAVDIKGMPKEYSDYETGVPYIQTDSDNEALTGSQYVLKLTITNIINTSNTNTFCKAKVVEEVKGNLSLNEIYVSVPNDAVVEGKTYKMGLNRVSDDSYVFVVSSLNNSIFSE